jgi:hypothetical protein
VEHIAGGGSLLKLTKVKKKEEELHKSRARTSEGFEPPISVIAPDKAEREREGER